LNEIESIRGEPNAGLDAQLDISKAHNARLTSMMAAYQQENANLMAHYEQYTTDIPSTLPSEILKLRAYADDVVSHNENVERENERLGGKVEELEDAVRQCEQRHNDDKSISETDTFAMYRRCSAFLTEHVLRPFLGDLLNESLVDARVVMIRNAMRRFAVSEDQASAVSAQLNIKDLIRQNVNLNVLIGVKPEKAAVDRLVTQNMRLIIETVTGVGPLNYDKMVAAAIIILTTSDEDRKKENVHSLQKDAEGEFGIRVLDGIKMFQSIYSETVKTFNIEIDKFHTAFPDKMKTPEFENLKHALTSLKVVQKQTPPTFRNIQQVYSEFKNDILAKFEIMFRITYIVLEVVR
jgi:hypothetical protein